MMTVLCDPKCAFAYLGTFTSMFAQEFYVGCISLHLERAFLFEAGKMGYVIALNPLFYLPTCILMPFILRKLGTPPRLISFLSFIPIVLALMLMGPSEVFGLPNDWRILAAGLALLGVSIAPIFILCLPEVHNQLVCKYKIVEKSNEALDGRLSDQEAALYAQFYAAAAFVAPMTGSALYDVESLGWIGTLDVMMISYAIIGIIFLLGYSGFTPYSDYKAQQE